MIVADTDVLIDFLAGRDPAAERVSEELQRGNLAATAITRFEMLSGARSARQLDVIVRLLDSVAAMPLDAAAADRAATVRRGLEREGRGIGMADSLIAGIVLNDGGVLLTRNRRHFERIEELQLAEIA